ncbi:hypothetical protein Cni_G02912 [Canna indica]|uniref:Uncharacterized protein n=1 Tax=Canna indica TaxID=4628 RepID=A0AAQ3Q2L4_9LILI|nr:hypothetical protein Cni_G02912 [Canna indica]
MEKCRSFPDHYYSSSTSGGFGYENRSNSYSFNGPSEKGEGFASASDPELKRKRRVASYNSFAVERKLKSSVRNSFKWIKNKFTDTVYGV